MGGVNEERIHHVLFQMRLAMDLFSQFVQILLGRMTKRDFLSLLAPLAQVMLI